MITLSTGSKGKSSTKTHIKYLISKENFDIQTDVSTTEDLLFEYNKSSKTAFMKDIIEHCMQDKSNRANGITDRRLLFSPPHEISKNLSKEEMLLLCNEFISENLKGFSGYLIYHENKEHKHIHCIFRAKNEYGKTINISNSEHKKIYKNYISFFEEKFPDQMNEHKKNIEEKLNNLTEKGKNYYEENLLLPGNNDIRDKNKNKVIMKEVITFKNIKLFLENAIKSNEKIDDIIFMKINDSLDRQKTNTFKSIKYKTALKELLADYNKMLLLKNKEEELNILENKLNKLNELIKEKCNKFEKEIKIEKNSVNKILKEAKILINQAKVNIIDENQLEEKLIEKIKESKLDEFLYLFSNEIYKNELI